MKVMNDNTKIYSSKQEHLVAKLVDGKVVAGSGARDLHPGDVKNDEFLIECKTHMTRTDRIEFFADVWDKISSEAESRLKFPALVVDNGTQTPEGSWVLTRIGAIQVANCKMFECPCKISVNLKFSHDQFLKITNMLHQKFNAPIAYVIPFNPQSLVLLTLQDFVEVRFK